MTTLLQLRTRARALINERTARLVLDTDLNDLANAGVKDFSTRVQWYERVVGVPVVAKKVEYQNTLFSDMLKLIMVRWLTKYRLKLVDLSEWAATTFFHANPTGIPGYANLSPHDKVLRIWPPPTASSPATTLTGEGIDAVTTTIPCASTSGFDKHGIILFATGEQVYYDDTNATNFLLCRRGDGDTTAASHSFGEAITQGSLVLTTAAIPPTLALDADVVKFPVAYEDALVYYMAGNAELIRQNQAKSEYYLKIYEARREEASLERFWNVRDGSPAVKDEEYDMGWYGMP